MNSIQIITFDLDDTLWEIHPVIKRAEARLYAWLGEHYPSITALYEPSDLRQLRAEVVAEMADRAHDLTFLRRTVLSRVGEAAGVGTGFIDDAFEVFDEARNDVEIFPGVIPALEALQGRFTLIAVTNGNANLKKIGIEHLFSAVVTAAMAGAAKPARAAFDMAVELGGAGAGQALHVGDHPLYDVDGARNAGLRTAWLNRNNAVWPDEYPRADLEVTHVAELPAVLGIS